MNLQSNYMQWLESRALHGNAATVALLEVA